MQSRSPIPRRSLKSPDYSHEYMRRLLRDMRLMPFLPSEFVPAIQKVAGDRPPDIDAQASLSDISLASRLHLAAFSIKSGSSTIHLRQALDGRVQKFCRQCVDPDQCPTAQTTLASNFRLTAMCRACRRIADLDLTKVVEQGLGAPGGHGADPATRRRPNREFRQP
jgi:hypothetical protein